MAILTDMDTVEQALAAVPRERFLPPVVASQAAVDAPLPIGHGQTNSQPATVAMMLEWLSPEPGDHALDVGSGSGWTSALLAYLVSPHGRVVAVEIVPELVEFGRKNCQRVGAENVVFHQAGKSIGYPADAPYDRILVSASARELPVELVDQLAPRGTLVIPVGSDVLAISKDPPGCVDVQIHPGFAFVPLI